MDGMGTDPNHFTNFQPGHPSRPIRLVRCTRSGWWEHHRSWTRKAWLWTSLELGDKAKSPGKLSKNRYVFFKRKRRRSWLWVDYWWMKFQDFASGGILKNRSTFPETNVSWRCSECFVGLEYLKYPQHGKYSSPLGHLGGDWKSEISKNT